MMQYIAPALTVVAAYIALMLFARKSGKGLYLHKENGSYSINKKR